jgi:hypothetical protein
MAAVKVEAIVRADTILSGHSRPLPQAAWESRAPFRGSRAPIGC